jgi:acyl transferase domain-containing protein
MANRENATAHEEDAVTYRGPATTNYPHVVTKEVRMDARLVPFTANDVDSARQGAAKLSRFLASHSDQIDDAAYTMGMRRQHFPYRSFAVMSKQDAADQVEFSAPIRACPTQRTIVFVFTGQGSQWPTMGSTLLSDYRTAMEDVLRMDKALAALGQDIAPPWALAGKNVQFYVVSCYFTATQSPALLTGVYHCGRANEAPERKQSGAQGRLVPTSVYGYPNYDS